MSTIFQHQAHCHQVPLCSRSSKAKRTGGEKDRWKGQPSRPFYQTIATHHLQEAHTTLVWVRAEEECQKSEAGTSLPQPPNTLICIFLYYAFLHFYTKVR